jgi:hypothetical protein
VTLRAHPIEQHVVLPSGREATVSIGMADDPYIPPSESETVALVLRTDDEVLGVVNTILDPEHESEARMLVRELAAALESGEAEPTAECLEPYADRIPDVR